MIGVVKFLGSYPRLGGVSAIPGLRVEAWGTQSSAEWIRFGPPASNSATRMKTEPWSCVDGASRTAEISACNFMGTYFGVESGERLSLTTTVDFCREEIPIGKDDSQVSPPAKLLKL